MDYSLYRAEDFAADESFNRYYLRSHDKDIQFWEEWIRLHPEKMDEVIIAEQLLDRLFLRLPAEELEAEQNRMLQFMAQRRQAVIAELPAAETPAMVKHPRKRRSVLAWLAVPVAAAIAAVTVYYVLQPKPLEWQSYTNPAGKRSTVLLDDGSKVILNAGTTLQYHRWEKGDSMRIRLNGEAFFEVSPQAGRAFVVTAGEVQIAVLGTSFNVQTPANGQPHAIALVDGRIRLHTPAGDTILLPQQQARYVGKGTPLQIQSFDTEVATGWKEGIIKWKNASLEEVAATLLKTWNITLVNKSGKQPAGYTGRFVNTRYETILKSYCYINRLQYTVKGNTIILENQR
ncbi:ferric-dicitrate binding protein FerR (iron transport regulator) [Filimonas zeae]|uniref:FecR family protein n=1 Tax=Filimonas zeae TaxID=1737353 RepID=A0A917IPA8_9BACT|nr:FecR family protein [Filimonas zeae]MDR6337800.1 ferric-dicitrate binding protein FerR (iron transport regulator) [Filimonas zeae]GGH60322.1 hypothetical protein GCM10011379_08050 [Filimonas zeae]